MNPYLTGRILVNERSEGGLAQLESILADHEVPFDVDTVRPHGEPPRKFLILRKLFEPRHFTAMEAIRKRCDVDFTQIRLGDPFSGDNWWANEDKRVVAVVVRAAFEVPWQERSSSPEDYLYFCEKQKQGRLKRDAMVDFSKPLGSQKRVIAGSEFDYFLSPMMIDALELTDDFLRPITVRGKPSRWKRLDVPPATANVLHPTWNSPTPYSHPLCGHEYRIPLGVWLGIKNPYVPDGIGETQQKFGHVPNETTLVVSLSVARKLIKLRCKVRMEPVYDYCSDISRSIRKFVRLLLG